MNHIEQLTAGKLPWNFPCYCNTILLRVLSSRWIRSWI